MHNYTPRILTLLILLVFISCTEQYQPKEGEYKMTVKNHIGKTFQYNSGNDPHYFLPYPINEGLGSINDKNVNIALIGKQLDANADLYVVPIARLRYTLHDDKQEVIFAIPAEKKYRTMEIAGYDDLITEYYSTKQILDYWYANRYGLGAVTDVYWSPF